MSSQRGARCAGQISRAVVISALAAVQLATGAAPAAALAPGCTASGTTVTCTYSAGVNAFAVPSGVSSVHVTAIGGASGSASGALVSGGIATGGLSTLYAVVGGDGQAGAGGANGGGDGCQGGGGASDVRTNATSLSSRVLVAGGAGGAGCDATALFPTISTFPGGPGGDAGAPGGASPGDPTEVTGGGPGTGSSGGAGGVDLDAAPATNGTDGALGHGGSGGAGDGFGGGAGGGGGGGLFGGGGGAGGWLLCCGSGGAGVAFGGAGGGGGSSLAPTGGTIGSPPSGAAPVITIAYSVPSGGGLRVRGRVRTWPRAGGCETVATFETDTPGATPADFTASVDFSDSARTGESRRIYRIAPRRFGVIACHRFSAPGTYSALVSVQDPSGRSGSATATLIVNAH